MRKKFKSKKRKVNLFKIIISILLVILIYNLITTIFFKIKLTSSNEEFLSELLKEENHHLKYENKKENIISKTLNNLYQIDISRPITILRNIFNYNDIGNLNVVTSSDNNVEEVASKYIEDPKPINIENPIVYIYNTHQTEGYSYKKYESYNITPNVMMASYVFREKLNKKGIPTILETTNIKDLLNANSWDYSNSYKASRFLVKDALNKYKSLKLIIDLHRDSIKKSSSTITINGKNYAKVLFVIGKEYKTYEKNKSLATKLSNMINNIYPNLSRGVMMKEGKNVNGIYNQDLSDKNILIECGGLENNLEEVINTIDVLSEIIEKYLGD